MTIAEKAAFKSLRIKEIGEKVKAILRREGRPLDLPTLEFYLQAEEVDRGGQAGDLDTFAVRDAVSKLVTRHEVAFTEEDEVQLV